MAFSRTSTATTAGDIYGLIRAAGATTRTEIGEQTGLSRTAVAARVAALADQGLIVEREQAPSTGGRPAALLTFNADAGVVLAAAIGRSRTRLAVCNLAGEILAAGDIDQEIGIGPDELMPDVVKRLDVLLDGHRDARIHGVGLCLPGTVDQQRGCSLDSPIMSGWDGVPLAPVLRRADRCARHPRQRRQRHCAGRAAGRPSGRRRCAGHQGFDGSRSGHHRRGFATARRGTGGRRVRSQQDARRRRGAVPMRRHRLPGSGRGRLGAGAGADATGPRGRPHPRRRGIGQRR